MTAAAGLMVIVIVITQYCPKQVLRLRGKLASPRSVVETLKR
jgi:hypothetical protein